jgi:hypothetical protein
MQPTHKVARIAAAKSRADTLSPFEPKRPALLEREVLRLSVQCLSKILNLD